MTVLQLFAFAAVALAAPAIVLTRDPLRQALVLGVYGLALALLYFILAAPDVGLSQIVVSAVGLPVMVLLALVKIRDHERERDREDS